MSDTCIATHKPLAFEQLGQGYGFILYTTKLKDVDVHGRLLSIPNLHDRAYIQIGSRSVGILHRTNHTSLLIDLPNNTNDTLYIFVENMGRINYGDDSLDNKGILEGGVLLDQVPLLTWRTCLTRNFIPNYQGLFKSDKYGSSQPFVDIAARYMTPQNLLTSARIKYDSSCFGNRETISCNLAITIILFVV